MRVLIGFLVAMFGAVYQSSAPVEADEILTQLSKIRLDKRQTHSIRDITIRRDAFSITLNRGLIGFLEPVAGKVTGAVFIGSGEIVAIPPDPIEKQQVYKFTGTPILNEVFQSAIFRFTDGTYEEIQKEISLHAEEEVTADDMAQFDPWDETVEVRAKLVNFRLLADFLEPQGRPLFFGELNGDKRGWFDIVFDQRVPEEVTAFKLHDIGGTSAVDVWTSFNQRNEVRDLELVAHENKSAIDILAYDIDATVATGKGIDAKVTMRLKGLIDGTRILNFELSPLLRVSSISTDTGESVPFYQYPNANSSVAILPRGLKAGQELTLRFAYAGSVDGREPWYPSQPSRDLAMFNLNLHAPADLTMVATGDGEFPSAGFELLNRVAFADEKTVEPILDYFS